jgi:hypothetical protein
VATTPFLNQVKPIGFYMLRFTSLLNHKYIEALERLMFFNPGQSAMHDAIVDSVERFGLPSIVIVDGRLRINVEKLNDVQSLFALEDDRLVGSLVYFRFSIETLTIIHIAVDEDYSSDGKFSHHMLTMRMLDLLRSNARRISGVDSIRIMYGGSRILDYRV